MSPFPSPAWLETFRKRLNADPEMQLVGAWFTTAISLTFGNQRFVLRLEKGSITEIVPSPRLDVPCSFGFRAPLRTWKRFLSKTPPPIYHDFFAMMMRAPEFVLEGDTLAAMQNARALHRMMNLMRGAAPISGKVTEAFEAPIGRYLGVRYGGMDFRIFVEESGEGIPLLCLHTAGADSRQYRHVLNDRAVTSRYRVIAFDMPYHGRSDPPAGWWLKKYRLTTKDYLGLIRAVWKALGLKRPVVMGCSMGGAIVLQLAADYQRELRGIVGLESAAHAPGRYNEFLHHPAIHGGELCASYTLGLCGPGSPEEGKRDNWWYYSQSGPGVYQGDVYYYSCDWDARKVLRTIDTKLCKVSLLTGEYDYSCTPAMTRAVANAIPGARFRVMRGIGHFPMIENYPAFRPFLLRELAAMAE